MSHRLLGAAAIALGRTADIERALRNDPDALKPGNRWGMLIVRASERAPGHVIERLIRAGASVDVRDSTITSVDGTEGYTPLHAAAFHANAEAVTVLLEHGANPNAALLRGEHAETAVAFYNGVFVLLGLSFGALFVWITHDDRLLRRLPPPEVVRAARLRFTLGEAVYLLALGLSFVWPPAALALHAAMALYYAFDQASVPADRPA